MNKSFKSGVAALAGRPNVGKSSLVNRLLDFRLSVVTPKPQTTRDAILGLYNDEDCQIVFVDTPGVHEPEHRLGERLVDRALEALDEADVILYVVTIDDRPFWSENRTIIGRLKETKTPVILCVNKVDLPGSREKILPVISLFQKELDIRDAIPMSARDGTHRELLLQTVKSYLPEGVPLYPDDQVTDRPERFLAAEIIRGKAMEMTEEEVPHSLAVEIDEYKSPDEYPDRTDLLIRATVYVERPGQRAILLGAGGRMIRAVGSAARKELERLTGHKVFLDLWVKVSQDWRDSERELRRLGYGE